MAAKSRKPKTALRQPQTLVPTGIEGLDRILLGGYRPGRPIVIRGASGTGKSIFSLFFADGKRFGNGPAVYATFDEPPENLIAYTKAWGDFTGITFLDFRPDPEMQVSGGGYQLSGLLVRLDHAVQKTGATRVVLDAFDNLFDSFEDKTQVRRDLFRVFNWCRERNLTLLATTGEEADYRPSTGTMDYASDCTILLGQRMEQGLMTRTVRVLKRRGMGHGTNEYPFIIAETGISVMPVTETRMIEKSSRRRLSTGIGRLDRMLGGKGVWEGSTVMVSGQSGTGKSLLAATMAASACANKKHVLYFSFEESPGQIVRDVESIGIDLRPYVNSGDLTIDAERAVERGLEEHTIRLIETVKKSKPDIVVLDPISALADLAEPRAFKNSVLRLCHFLKNAGITVVLAELLSDDSAGVSNMNVSSLIDTWVRLRRIERDGDLVRLIHVHKSRGARTSGKVEEFAITDHGFAIGLDSRTSISDGK